MKKALLKKLLISCALFGFFGFPCLNAKGWEAIKSDKVQAQHIVSETELEIKAGGGVIYVITSKSVNIKIFTILGSRIADDTLSPGAHQFAVPAHGVYIIKAGDLTCKVAV